MKKYAVIVAGGTGSRAGGDIPKQFQNVAGRPMLWWSIRAFRDEDETTRIIVVMHRDYIDFWNDYILSLPGGEVISHIVCEGGASRLESVRNGLAMCGDEDALVAVHDAARPMVTRRMIADGWAAASKHGCAVPVVPVSDSLRHLCGTAEYLAQTQSETVNRADYVAVQTPQVFGCGLLKEAYSRPLTAAMTDDASVAEAAGHRITLFAGDSRNIKVTNPVDFLIAGCLMKYPDAVRP